TVYMLGGFQSLASLARDEEELTERFRAGEGFGWHEHDPDLFHGTEKFFRPTYRGSLVRKWIPALQGVEPKLARGARVADVGCGHGASTRLMARNYPASTVIGFDFHKESMERAPARGRGGVGRPGRVPRDYLHHVRRYLRSHYAIRRFSRHGRSKGLR
ncbi:MAG: methyltransferase domain-containing protein, partial [Actinobacteria bacterium]|nr:methyltransferase domain-containing protein [Actinomycetota bacterium]